MVDPRLAGAFIDGSSSSTHAPGRLLGCRLRKFSLWHRLLLNTLDSPFMHQGAVTMWDLRTAIGVCRNGYGDSRIRRPWLVPGLIYVGLLLSLLWPWRKAPRVPGQNALQAALQTRVEAFLEYTQDYLQEPKYAIIPRELPKGAVPPPPMGRAPDEFECVAEIVEWSRWSMETVWNLPIGQANWCRVMARRAQGNAVDFTTPEEEAFQATLPPEYRRSGAPLTPP